MRKTINQIVGSASSLLLLVATANSQPCGNGSTTITNLPTLGGSILEVKALNSAGQLTGFSSVAGDASAHAFLYGGGVMTDVGTLGGDNSQGLGLNSLGQAVGDADLAGNTEMHAFSYNGGGLADLGTLGGTISSAIGINDAGQIAGNSLVLGNEAQEAFLFANGSMTSLGTLGGIFSGAVAINQSGSIAGDSMTAGFELHAFLYTNGAMVDLGTLSGSFSSAFALNDSDAVVGESSLSSGEVHAFLYSSGVMTDLGVLGGTFPFSSARAVNDSGQVIGISTTTADQTHGFIHSGGTMTDLGTLGGNSSQALALNNLGQVVGESETAGSVLHGFLWQNGTMTDLNTLLPANSGWELTSANFINDAGRIVGLGIYNGVSQWFVLDLGGGANHPPVAVAGPNQTAECHAAVTLDGSQSSDPDGDSLTYQWAEGAVVLGANATLAASFDIGTHTITLTVTDPCGAFSQANVTVLVTDTTPPVIICPDPITVSANRHCASRIPDLRSLVVVSDNCSGPEGLTLTQQPAPGTVAELGQHPIVVTVTDPAGNSASCSTFFTVVDSRPPVILEAPRSVTVSANHDCQGEVPDLAPRIVAWDSCTPAESLVVTQSPAAGTLLEKGRHFVTVTVTDAAGNSVSRNVILRIVDKTAPTIHSLTANPNVLTPANDRLVPVKLTAVASDNCDSSPACKIVSVTCDERTAPGDIRILGNLKLALAASHKPSGDGRVYTITVRCTDDAGNSTFAKVTVSVPKQNK